MKQLVITLFSLLICSCKVGNQGVFYEELMSPPILQIGKNKVIVTTSNSKQHSALAIYDIDYTIDKVSKEINIQAYQALVGKNSKTQFEITPEDSTEVDWKQYKFYWVDPDGKKTELDIKNQAPVLIPSLTFDTQTTESGIKIIHPILSLQNTTQDTIHFFWSLGHSGTFEILDDTGKKLPIQMASRSGPYSEKVIPIAPNETAQFDCYDYGYGIRYQENMFVFNTYSFQTMLSPKKYTINYKLDTQDKNWKQFAEDATQDVSSIWQGQLQLQGIDLDLSKETN